MLTFGQNHVYQLSQFWFCSAGSFGWSIRKHGVAADETLQKSSACICSLMMTLWWNVFWCRQNAILHSQGDASHIRYITYIQTGNCIFRQGPICRQIDEGPNLPGRPYCHHHLFAFQHADQHWHSISKSQTRAEMAMMIVVMRMILVVVMLINIFCSFWGG